ncbi:hypothetical protein O181_005124 [Austropuccinia psidii MF-1]|uniref:Uncharacterized protein n=1 Tax=Austropuccinia psidii MF-1 TaxID=1389203 RepID=A0A9Q3BHI7_9BASI|nr:hypothetical protein [Austropuccinia psidii MF-1]
MHRINGRNYSVQPYGSGQGRGKTKVRPSSRKAHLEDGTVAPNCPRSVPIHFWINSELKLIEDNVLRVEPLPSGSNRNISLTVQKLVHRSQGGRVGNMPKPLAGGYEILLTHQEISGSGEDHRGL